MEERYSVREQDGGIELLSGESRRERVTPSERSSSPRSLCELVRVLDSGVRCPVRYPDAMIVHLS